MFNELMEKLTDLEAFDRLIGEASSRPGAGGIFARVRDEIGIRVVVDGPDLETIPRSGPLIVVANHPTGFAEGLVVPALLDSIRRDVFVLGHSFFDRWPSLAERMVLVNPQAGRSDSSQNGRAVIQAARRVRQGACMLMFPAGAVARPTSLDLKAKEAAWHTGLAKIVRLSGASILPIHVSGSPSLLFRAASLLHPRLGVPLLFREALRAGLFPMKISVGPMVTAGEFNRSGSAQEAVDRVRAVLLGEGESSDPHFTIRSESSH